MVALYISLEVKTVGRLGISIGLDGQGAGLSLVVAVLHLHFGDTCVWSLCFHYFRIRYIKCTLNVRCHVVSTRARQRLAVFKCTTIIMAETVHLSLTRGALPVLQQRREPTIAAVSLLAMKFCLGSIALMLLPGVSSFKGVNMGGCLEQSVQHNQKLGFHPSVFILLLPVTS